MKSTKRAASSSRKSKQFRSGSRSGNKLGGPCNLAKPLWTVRRAVWFPEWGAAYERIGFLSSVHLPLSNLWIPQFTMMRRFGETGGTWSKQASKQACS